LHFPSLPWSGDMPVQASEQTDVIVDQEVIVAQN
jgi:hypothetical protein